MCTPPAPTFDNPSTWTLTHATPSCQNTARINVSAGCGSSGWSLRLRRTMNAVTTTIYDVALPDGPFTGTEYFFAESPSCGRVSITYQWEIHCAGVVEDSSDSKATSQGGPGEITFANVAADENCLITAEVRVKNENCGECPGVVKLYRKTGVVPTYHASEVVYSAATPPSTYASDVHQYQETLPDGTYFYSWRLENADGGVDATSVPVSVNPECNPYVIQPVELPVGEFEKQVVLVQVSGTPATGWTYTDKKILNSNEQRLEWFYHKNGGCGSFRLLTHEFLDDFFDDALAQAWEVHVRIKLGGETAYSTWFRGVIRGIRQQEQGAEQYTEIDGFGYVEMLEKIQIQRPYPAGWTVKDVVHHIVQNYIRPYTRVVVPYDLDPTNGDFGIDPSPYVLQSDLHFECSALRAIKFLAELQGNREWGVDADRKFYFRESASTVRKAFFIGHDLIDRVAGGKTFQVANQIKVAGKDFGSRDLLKVRADVTDITQNGLYELPREVPWVTGDSDASRWADNIIDKHKTTQGWSIFQWQNINLRVEATQPIGKIRIYGSDVSNDVEAYDVSKIQYIEGGFKATAEVKEMGIASQQSNLDQPPLRAMLFVGPYPLDVAEELLERLKENVDAFRGRNKQRRYPNDVTSKELPGRIPGEIKHFSKDVTNHDITNNPAELQDITNPRGMVMAWLDGQWQKVSIRRTVHTLPSRGKYIGEIIALITDITNQGFGELRWWDGDSWEQFGTGSGGGSGPELSDDPPYHIDIGIGFPGQAGTSDEASRADHKHYVAVAGTADVTASNVLGVSSALIRSDHQHKGIHTIRVQGQPDIFGHIDVTAKNGVKASQSGNLITIEGNPSFGVPHDVTNTNIEGSSSDFARKDHQHKGLLGIRVKGQNDLFGFIDVTAEGIISVRQEGNTLIFGGPGGAESSDIEVLTDAHLETEQSVSAALDTTSTFSTSSTSGATITDTSFTINLTRQTDVLIAVSGSLKHIPSGDLRSDAQLGVVVDGTYYFGGHLSSNNLGTAVDAPGSLVYRVNLAAGSHTIGAALRSIGLTAYVGRNLNQPVTTVASWVEVETTEINEGAGSNAENVGNSGVGVFHDRVNGVHQFKKLSPGSSRISILDDVTNTVVVIDVTNHAVNHQKNGSDPIKLDDLADPDDNTDLNATDQRHGLLAKLPDVTNLGKVLHGDHSWAYASVFPGDILLGTGEDGSLTLVANTVLADTNGVINFVYYSELNIGSFTLTQHGNDHVLGIHVTGDITGTGGVIFLTPTQTGPAGGSGAGGGGAGGLSGERGFWMRVFAKRFTGSGTCRANGGNGRDGGNATTATATASGANGTTGSNQPLFRGASMSVTGSSTVGNGGVSTGAGGTGGSGTGVVVDGHKHLMAYPFYFFFETVWNDSVTSGELRTLGGEPDGSGAGGRNTGAQGAGGGGSGGGATSHFAQAVNGSDGGAGLAGAAGAGGGGGGPGGPGSVLVAAAHYCASAWTFESKGGGGGRGGNGFGNGGGGGGGPGGGGGWVRLALGRLSPTPATSAAGGEGGDAGTGGAGNPGGSGVQGNDGNAGRIEFYVW